MFQKEGIHLTAYVLRWGPPLCTLICLGFMMLIAMNRDLSFLSADAASLQSFTMLFISLILEALPFILLGVLVSSLLQVYVSDHIIQRMAPKHPIGGVLFGSLLGLLFPLCECGMIPVVRRLLRKGMPAYIGIVFILAGPILNPIVYASTYTAFRSQPEMVYARMGLAFAVTVTIGLLLWRYMKGNPLRPQRSAFELSHSHSHTSDPSHAHHHHMEHHPGQRSKLATTLGHTSDEFFEMGKYLLFGALLTALIQVSISRETMLGLGEQPLLASLFMMGFAFILSLCSTSDAFVASSFSGAFQPGALLAFLVFGPMIDLKNTLMLLSVFRLKIVFWLVALTFVLVLAGAYAAHRFYFS